MSKQNYLSCWVTDRCVARDKRGFLEKAIEVCRGYEETVHDVVGVRGVCGITID